ncbi:thiamine phosphate synthase [Chryseobacterium sp. Mn2064]|uniref:thiamine phosphate synthase n=1 Tax=Chryseobacterium sp. Mn2064 TaxID=3395263 RepID=UPI003BCE36E5
MILVITPEKIVSYEAEIINQLFQEGLDLLHIRKPGISRHEMIRFIDKIDASFYPQLVLHNHHELGERYGISRFHFREPDRQEGICRRFVGENILSTSVHDITTYNTLGKEWEYAFISPFFPSISKKGYGENSTVMESVNHKENSDVKLIALGGIASDNIEMVLDAGADGVALLGAIWENEDALRVFRECRKNIIYRSAEKDKNRN